MSGQQPDSGGGDDIDTGEAEAERKRIDAEAEAAAIFMRLDAEARGQYEILAKKAAAMKELVEACGGAREAYQLMMLEHLDTLAETSAKAISNIKFDKVVVWDTGAGDGANGGSSTANFLAGMVKSLPPLHDVAAMAGLELPKYLGDAKATEALPVVNGELK